LSKRLGRGTVDCLISLKESGGRKPVSINNDLAKAYYRPIAELSKELELDPSHILSTLLKLPEVITPTGETLTEQEWEIFQKVIEGAIENLDMHRLEEGRSLESDCCCASAISVNNRKRSRNWSLSENKRSGRLVKVLEDNVARELRPNRLEQELIYYIEKIDLSEEQVRLKNHCEYFRNILAEGEESKGKKLSFVLQEIGREINTTGAKAYDSAIQNAWY